MKFKDLQKKKPEELQKMLKDLRIQLGQLQFELGNKALKDTSKLGKIKIEIARINTALHNNMDVK